MSRAAWIQALTSDNHWQRFSSTERWRAEIIRIVADKDPMIPSEIDGDLRCFWCGSDTHAEDCAWKIARLILKRGASGESDSTAGRLRTR